MNGGGQERGLRSGTLAPALSVGLGEACRVAKEEISNDHVWVSYLSKRLEDGIKSQCESVFCLFVCIIMCCAFFSPSCEVTLSG